MSCVTPVSFYTRLLVVVSTPHFECRLPLLLLSLTAELSLSLRMIHSSECLALLLFA